MGRPMVGQGHQTVLVAKAHPDSELAEAMADDLCTQAQARGMAKQAGKLLANCLMVLTWCHRWRGRGKEEGRSSKEEKKQDKI